MSVKLYFVLLVIVLELSYVLSGPAVKSNYIEQENSCREVCGLCDCDGFYCEDECICECSIQDEDNLQCIADMKTECDKNGLEYELLMQEATKERFLRQIRPNLMPFEKLSKNLVIIKKKREDSSAEHLPHPVEEPHAAEEPRVAAPHLPPINIPAFPANPALPNLNIDFGNLDFSNIPTLDIPTLRAPEPIQFPNLEHFDAKKLMMTLRDRMTTDPPTIPTIPTPRPVNLPTLPALPPFSFPNMQDLIVQPLGTLEIS